MRNTFGYHFWAIVVSIAITLTLVGCSSHSHSSEFVSTVRANDTESMVRGKTDERIETYGSLYCEMYYDNDTVSMMDVMDTVESLGLRWDQWLVIEESAEEAGLCN
jgi:hypothetical protein